MRKGQLVGPYDGSLPDRALGFVEAGVDNIYLVSHQLGISVNKLKQGFRHLCKRGFVAIRDDRIIPLKGRP